MLQFNMQSEINDFRFKNFDVKRITISITSIDITNYKNVVSYNEVYMLYPVE